MKTIIHAYSFDVGTAQGAADYKALCEKLTAKGLKCFETWGGGAGHYTPFAAHDGETVTLETQHLFDNQWNTAPFAGSDKGWRVFDWAQDYLPNRSIKRGHWLDQTEEMAEVRRNTCKCGYCGKQEPAAKGFVFCPHCLDSEYLKETDLHLLRMLPVSGPDKRSPLTAAERGHLLPLYRQAQIHGSTERGKARIAKAREDIETSYTATVENATAERDAKRWIVENCPAMLANYIYYSHTRQHCFGWRGDGLGAEQASALLDVISDFPFPYTIKCADGRQLTAV